MSAPRTPQDMTDAARLIVIEGALAVQRRRWAQCLDAGHDGECEFVEGLIDDLVAERAALTRPAAS